MKETLLFIGERFPQFIIRSLVYLIFGSAFLFIVIDLIKTPIKEIPISFRFIKPFFEGNEVKFIIFAYIIGLFEYALGALFMKFMRIIFEEKEKKEEEKITDVEIWEYLLKNKIAKEIYMGEILRSYIFRVFLGFMIGVIGLLLFLFWFHEFFSPILIIVVIFGVILFYNREADREVHNLSNQIKKVIKKKKK